MDQYCILVVDQDEETMPLFYNAQKIYPCLILGAKSSEEAFEVINNHTVDIIICALELSGLNGIDLLKKTKESHPSILRILFSKAAAVHDLLDAVNKGEIYRYLQKPFKPEEIPLIISESCRYCAKINTKKKLMSMLSDQNHYLETLKNQLESKVFISNQALSSAQRILEKMPYYIVAWDKQMNRIYQNKEISLLFDLQMLLKSTQNSEGGIIPEKKITMLGGWKIQFREYSDQIMRYVAVLQKEDVLYE